ncbi:EAL domain-containing protein [Aliivibrio fischeri]|uniref:bifunctional diguanylate cyclase/phosphodiesterase n=1 Tax=Aliivibrio fischeri TaxID=668 RepID=UPI0018C5BE06|nr:EAL domain-containing protein [Aliivibrio fischeri]
MSCKNNISLKFAITVPFMIIFTLIMTVVLNSQASIYRDMISHISEKLLDSSSRSIDAALYHQLEDPLNANINMRNTIERNELYLPENAKKLQRYLNQNLKKEVSTLKQVDIIGYGNQKGDYIGFRKNKNNGTTHLLLKEQNSHLYIYQGDNLQSPVLNIIKNYDPRTRPWYQKSLEDPKARWSDIYSNVEENESSLLSAISPVYNKNKELEGVITTDVLLTSFNKFLDKEADEINGNISIVDSNGTVWLHSDHNPNAPMHHDISRINSIENPIVKETILYIEKVGFDNALQEKIISLNIDGQKHFMMISPFRKRIPVEGYIIASIPESTLLGALPQRRQFTIIITVIACLIAFVLAVYVIRKLIKPIIDTANSAKELAQGNWDTPLPINCTTQEVMVLTRSFKFMASNLKRSFQELQDKVTYDSLTHLYSRTGLDNVISPAITDNSGLISFTINGFRDINDSVGHLSGDHLLVDISERLKTHYQDQNIEMARIGGAEFALFFYHIDDIQELINYAQQLQSIFNTPIQSASGEVVIQLSTGLVYQLNNHNAMHWLRSASLALAYAQSKSSKLAVFEPYMADISQKKTKLAAELSHAIKNEELLPYYQPLVNFEDGKIHGAEALIRWNSPQRGIVSPNEFIPLAEDNGMIINIGRMVLRQACIDTAQKIASGEWPDDFVMHVNVSTEQLHDGNSYQRLQAALTESGLKPKNLSLEIIESRLLNNDAFIIELLNKVRALGVHIAIDDFGTGYSSLSYLHTLPFDCLKIDRSFVKNLTRDNAETSIVNAIIHMAKGFNVSIVVEGVETKEQAEILDSLGCDIAQGYLYSKPLPIEQWGELSHLIHHTQA